MKKLVFVIPVLVLMLILSFVSACDEVEPTNTTEQTDKALEEGEKEEEVSEEEAKSETYPRAEDETWYIQVLSIRKSAEKVTSDNQQEEIHPTTGSTFLIIKATIVNKSSEGKYIRWGADRNNVILTDTNENDYTLAVIIRDYVVTICAGYEGLTTISPNAPNGEVIEFFFGVPEDVEADTLAFQFNGLSPITLSSIKES